MRQVKSCGILCFRHHPRRSFLLLRHPHRYDLPKGHIQEGETEEECAFRELLEETGITVEQVALVPGFRFVVSYQARYKRFGGEMVEKTLVIFLGNLKEHGPIVTLEHGSHEWIDWSPPHRIQRETIDPLLAEVERFLDSPRSTP